MIVSQEKTVGSFTVNVYSAHTVQIVGKNLYILMNSSGGKCTLDSVGCHNITICGNG